METAWDRIGFAGQVSHICAADVAQVISQLEKLPLPIGHSMGGLVVQKYLESDYQILAAVLLASFPPSGVIRTTLRIALQHPTAFFQGQRDLETLSDCWYAGTYPRSFFHSR